MISLGGLIGGIGGISIGLIAEPSNSIEDSAIPLATSLTGLDLGALLARGSDDVPEGASSGAPLLVERNAGLIVEVTDGDTLG